MTDQYTCARPSLADLTDKQSAVLEHLAQHKSSKEIARDLGVTQNTVDKHLAAVRQKWGTTDRYHTARIFEGLRGRAENHPPKILADDEYLNAPLKPAADLPKSAVFRLDDVIPLDDFDDWGAPPPKGPQALDELFGKWWRIAAVPLLALAALMVVMFAVQLAMELSGRM